MPRTVSKFRNPFREVSLSLMPDSDVLACTLYGEARGAGEEAIIAVGQVIMNRVEDGRYGTGIAGVCLRRLQFSCWWEANANGNLTIEAAQTLFSGERYVTLAEKRGMAPILVLVPGIMKWHFPPKVLGCFHYHTAPANEPERWPLWARGKTPLVKIGPFKFYDTIDPPKKRG